MKRFWTVFLGLLYLSAPLKGSSIIYLNDVWEQYSKGFAYLGARPALGKKGIHFLSAFIFDYNWPTFGGIQSRDFPLYQYLLNLQLGVETEPLLKLKGGRALIVFQYHQSQHPSLNYVGDWQGFDNINSPNLTQIGELWYEQSFWNKKFKLKLGKMDAYVDFNYTNYAQILINNSFSQNPTILGFPSYPNQEVGILAQVFPTPWLTLKASLFDSSNVTGVRTGAMGSRLFFNRLNEHALLLNEIDIQWGTFSNWQPGLLGIGVWGLTNTLPNFALNFQKGTAGCYAFLWQTLYKDSCYTKKRDKDHQKELGFFTQWGSCSNEVSAINTYLGGGVTYKNITSNLMDSFSLGCATTLFSTARESPFRDSYEMALEGTYQFFLFGFFLVQPDVQYIIHPGGLGNPNALVVTLRMMTSF